MITYLLGLPGSGKSYYAVDRIFNNFSDNEFAKKDKTATFLNCYTNINEFKFDKVNNTSHLDFEKLYEVLKRLHSFTKGKNKKSDKYLLKFCTRCKIKDTLFVIDEAHNFFDKKDIVLVWWLSYHRHLHHEIILITQNLSLIESKYKAFSEFFYVAKPSSLTLDKSHFKYNVFTHSRMSKASSVGAKKLKLNDDVFALYHSGDSMNSPNMVLKYLLISFSIFFILFIYVYFFVLKHDLSSDKKDDNNAAKKSLAVPKIRATKFQNLNKSSTNEVNTDYENRKFLTFTCAKNSCDNDLVSVPPQLLASFLKHKQVILIHKQKIGNVTKYFLDTSKEFYNYLIPKQRVSDDGEYSEDKNNLTISDIMPGSTTSK